MKDQNRLRELLPLYDGNELSPQERAQLETWLREVHEAQAELEAIRALHRKLQRAQLYEPEAHTLHRLRERLFDNLANAHSKTSLWEKFRLAWLSNARPAFQIGFAAAMLVLGVLLGRQFSSAPRELNQPVATDVLPLLLAQQPITNAQSIYSPRLANVHKIRFDQNTNQIEIEFSTVNDVAWRGAAEDPIARQVLAHAMREEEPLSLRLRAVRAVGEAASGNIAPDDALLDAVLQLLEQDDNAGVRIKAVQALKPSASVERVKQALIQALLQDQNAGVRIAALEALSGARLTSAKVEALEAAANDSNDYISREAARLLQNVSGGNVQ